MRREGSGPGPDWHVGEEPAARYAAGTAAESEAWSLEKHVEACGDCAAVVSSAVRAVAETGAVLAGIRAVVLERAAAEARGAAGSWAYAEGPKAHAGAESPAYAEGPQAGVSAGPSPYAGGPGAHAGAEPPVYADTTISTGTGAGAMGVPPRLSRAARVLWAAGPALRGAWLVALGVVVLGAVALSYGAGLGASVRPLLLVTAPVLPLAGVALSYGRHVDPLYEIAASTPAGGLRLLLTRAAAVLAVSVPALTLAGAALPASAGGPGAAAWLLPGLALTLAALALGSFVGSRRGAAAVGAAWLAFVVAPAAAVPAGTALMAGAAPYFAGPAVQSGWAAGAVACALLLAARRRSFDHLETP
ncbi:MULTISPECIES: zf-HC2 domain-containing protein [unclassified Streptomyces]|uniref:zf-HC2 domain-containing protein n=1 Tax=unclassified Streptomyces TaxID=2593676 RepID=UPI0033A229B7